MISVSCPARVEIGNKLDYPSLFLSMPRHTAATCNLAINLRTEITVKAERDDRITIESVDGFETYNSRTNSFHASNYPIILAILNHLNIFGVKITITTEIPRGSGLGGSGALLVALVCALLKHTKEVLDVQSVKNKLLLFCHYLENWLGFSATGFHDQLAAIYGGINLWSWGIDFKSSGFIYSRKEGNINSLSEELNDRMILAFTGESHPATKMKDRIHRYSIKELGVWLQISELSRLFFYAIEKSDWRKATDALNKECQLRINMNPKYFSDRARTLKNIADEEVVGARFLGHGHGGCVWAIGRKSRINEVLDRWQKETMNWDGAWTKRLEVAEKGITDIEVSI